MTTVTLPDGSTASFPDEMSQDDITSAINSHLNQMQGPWREPALAASSVAQGALAGAGALGDVEDWGGNKLKTIVYDPYIHPLVNRALTAAFGPYQPDMRPMPPGPLSSTSLLNAGRAVGAVDRPDLTPQNQTEQYIAATGQGVGGSLPYLWMGGINPVRAVIAGGAGGAAGELGAQMYPEHADLARAVGNLAVGAAVGGAPTATPNETQRAFDRLNITPTPADVSGSRWRQMLNRNVADMPMGGAVHRAMSNAVDQWGDALGNTADMLGPATTAQQAGAALQQGSRDWMTQFRANSKQAWDSVDMQIPAGTPTPVTNYAQTLGSVRSAMPAAPATAGVLQPALTRNLLDALMQDVQRGPLDWKTVSGIRTRIGEMLSDPNLVGDTSVTDLRRIYGALSSDMQQTANASGTNAAAAFGNAARITREGHDYIDNTVSNFLGPRSAPIDPEEAYNAAMTNSRSGGTLLQSVRDQMPGAADRLAGYELRRMGEATPGQQAVAGQGPTVSPTTFVTNTNRLSPEATSALFPGVQQQLADLRTTAGAMRQTAQLANTSGTGRMLSVREMLDVPRNMLIGGYAGHEFFGVPGAVGGAALGAAEPFAPGWIGSRLALRPLKNYIPGMLQYGARQYPAVSGLLNAQ